MPYSLSTLGLITWFGLYGINYFAKIPSVGIVLAIVALITSIALIVRK